MLATLSQFCTEVVDYHWVLMRSLNSWSTVNQYCVSYQSQIMYHYAKGHI